MTLNLVQHRTEVNVWERTGRGRDVERWVTGLAAGVCIATGLRRRTLAGLLLTMGGGGLAWWAAARSDVRRWRRHQLRAGLTTRYTSSDIVNEAAEESFPASDPPAWTPTLGAIDSGERHDAH